MHAEVNFHTLQKKKKRDMTFLSQGHLQQNQQFGPGQASYEVSTTQSVWVL